MILHLGILFTASGEVEPEPAFYLVRVRRVFCAVVLIHLDHAAFLRPVGACFVVEHRVPVELHAFFLRHLAELEQVLFATPFRGPGTFLVEFPEVVEVVDVVAVSLRRGGFAARWEPDGGDARVAEGWGGACEAFPVFLVGWDVPFETLEESGIFGCGFLLLWCGVVSSRNVEVTK